MYPVLNNCLVRGCRGDFFLQNYLSGKEFMLEELQANVLHNCDGANTIKSLADMFSQSENDLSEFLAYLQSENLVAFLDSPEKMVYPSLLEPPLLQDVQIEGTGQCNLYCKHCYGRESFADSAKNEMSTEEMLFMIDQIATANIGKCFLSGGEIFMRQDLPVIIDYLAKKHIHISGIFTNGTMYRPEIVTALKEAKLVTTFLVSLDGFTPKMHDFVRGEGVYAKTIAFIKKVIDEGFRVTVNTVAMKHNVGSLMAMKEFLSCLGISRWRISVPREQGEMIKNRDQIEPEWPDVFSAYKELLLDALEKPGKMRIQLSSIFKTEFLAKGYYLYNQSSSCCEYKKKSLVITADGNVISCPAGLKKVLGNVRTENILDIWRNEDTQAIKNLPILATECSGCEIWEYCGGGCRVIAEQIHGNRLAKDDNSCQLYHFFCDTVKPILESHGVAARKLREE